MPFQPGHPPYRRRSNLAVVEEGEPIPDLPQPRRWQITDLDPWLLERINFRWAAPEAMWRGKLAGYSSGNEYLFITNGEAVLLAMNLRHAMSGKPVVMEVFAFCREADLKDGVYGIKQDRSSIGDVALRALYRHMREWSKSLGAARVYVGVCSDLVPSTLKELMGNSSYYLVGAPC